MLFILTYNSAHYACAPYNCVVEAASDDEAEMLAEDFMDSHMREEFGEQAEEDGFDDDVCAYTLENVELFNESHECWQYFQDPSQAEFYPKVN